MTSDVQVKGLAELQAALDTLAPRIEANIMRQALKAGAKVLADEARTNVHTISGKLAESVRYGAKVNKVSGKVAAYVRAGGRKGKKAAFYAAMVEHGTAAHVIKARPPNKMLAVGVAAVHHPGAKMKPFMRPAIDTRGQAAIQRIAEYIRTRLADKHGIDVPAPVDPQAEPDE
jgi:HK97 gp10 family phage protein